MKRAFATAEEEANQLLDQFLGVTPSDSDDKTKKPDGINSTYTNPVRVGKSGKSFEEGDQAWVVGTFIPGQYVNETHPGGHNGVDLKAPKGTPVYAIGAGVVLEVGQYPKSGNYVKTWHETDKITAFYAHLDSIKASKGQSVTERDVIGTVGDTGNAKGRGDHLHLEIKQSGTLMDPLKLFGKKVGSLAKTASASIRECLNKFGRI